MKKLLGCFLCVMLLVFLAIPAGATLIYDQIVDMSGTGFGNVLSVLALQETGPAGTLADVEAGGVSWNGTSDAYFCKTVPDTIKYGANKTATRTIGELGWEDASEIRIIVNMSEQGSGDGQHFSIDALAMTIYDPYGTPLWSSSGFLRYDSPAIVEQGTGGSGIAFMLDAAQVASLNGVADWEDMDNRLGVNSSISYVDDGQDNIFAAKGPGASVPEPATMFLLGTGLIGLALFGRQRFKK